MPDISLLLRTHSPAQIVQMGYSSELEDCLHELHDKIPDDLVKEIMKTLKMIP